MGRMFDPGPKTYSHLLDCLDRQIELKYRYHSTVLDFTLKATPPNTEKYEQEALFEAVSMFEAPQEESPFRAEFPA